MFAAPVVHRRTRETYFSFTNDLGRYLGVPLLRPRLYKSTFVFVMDRISSRLSAWKAKLFHFTGSSYATLIHPYSHAHLREADSMDDAPNSSNRLCSTVQLNTALVPILHI
ncbi:hypothetical protein OIU84_021570 [Salix udensis]|uniref:Uncharacterized protein n=1 Tax=Salix udensis TaxID=889485 RepID=A0AAD6KWD5_9ROSI|nr:hypothetical protein OIU84_021570 [Salix udensis]